MIRTVVNQTQFPPSRWRQGRNGGASGRAQLVAGKGDPQMRAQGSVASEPSPCAVRPLFRRATKTF